MCKWWVCNPYLVKCFGPRLCLSTCVLCQGQAFRHVLFSNNLSCKHNIINVTEKAVFLAAREVLGDGVEPDTCQFHFSQVS